MKRSRLVLGVLVILIGLSFLIDIPIFKFAFALFVIWLGVRILTGSSGKTEFLSKSETAENSINRVLIFSGINQKLKSKDFQGGELVTVFGGGDLDLTESATKQDSLSLELVAIFGGIKVKLPESWNVNSEGVGVLGAFENRTKPGKEKGPTITIKGAAIFGGVEVVN
jgi:predicted membrane protein